MAAIGDYSFDISDSQETIPDSQKSRNSDVLQDQGQQQRDALIEKLLEKRNPITDIAEEHEAERRRRMYNMLRHSTHYKRLQVTPDR